MTPQRVISTPRLPDAPTDPTADIRANRELWDAWTRLHLDGGYDVAGFKAGRSTLNRIEVEEVGDVAGKTLLHLQCHFGLDTLSWVRHGAVATGADFSPAAIAAARDLSAETGLPARFVCADLYALPEAPELHNARFGVVFTSYGVLSWLPDLTRWARVIARFLAPGGVFYVVDRHPVVRLLLPREHDSAGHPIRQGYFWQPSPTRAAEHGSYATPEAEVWTTAAYWSHSIGEVVTALCEAGLRLEYLHEFPPSALPNATAPPAAPGSPSASAPPVPPERDDYPAWFSIRALAPPSRGRMRAKGPRA